MDITVERDACADPAAYEITTPSCIYTAQRKFFSLSTDVTVKGPRDRPEARIRGHFASIRSKYDYELAGGPIYHFWCENSWKGVYACEGTNESYRLYVHKGLNHSIFQANAQIAAFTKNRVTFGNGNVYDLRMNDDANVVVVVCMVLTVDSWELSGTTVNFDVGNIGPEDRPFDKAWSPT